MRDYKCRRSQPFIHYRIVHKVSLLVCHIAIKADISSKETSGITVQRTLVKEQMGFFSLLAGGWLVTNEKFMENALSVLSKLKFRGSCYGLVGNDQLAGTTFLLSYLR